MTQLTVRPARGLFDMFRPFETWTWPARFFDAPHHAPMRIEEYAEDGTLVVRAELPGIDPAKDVEVMVDGGVLAIAAERKEQVKETGYYRTEMFYGTYARTIALPEGTEATGVKATYTDGILEIRVPLAKPAAAQTVKVPVTAG